jgi:hypothetical protein
MPMCQYSEQRIKSKEQRRLLDMAKLVGFNGFYSQVVPNWEKINITKKIAYFQLNVSIKNTPSRN